MKKNIFSAALFLFLFSSAFQLIKAQDKVALSGMFEKSIHDFGSIKEENGPVSYEFKFTNTATYPITVNNVQASCGCTTPSWTKAEIEPGKSGYIKAQFDPKNRPGPFTKSLTVSSTNPGGIEVSVLMIKGIVNPKPKTPSDLFPKKTGNLLSASEYLNFGNIENKEPVTKEFKIYNNWNKQMIFSSPENVPSHMKVSVVPTSLNPRDTGVIKVTFDAKKKNDWGYVNDMFEVMTNDSVEARKRFFIVANVSQSFSGMTKDDSLKAPKIGLQKTTHDFGTVKQGDVVETVFEFSNIGKSDLKIYKTKTSCGCTVSEPEKTTLKPGEISKIKVSFNSTGKQGKDSKAIMIYSNDPTNPQAMLIIKSEVEKPLPADTSKTNK